MTAAISPQITPEPTVYVWNQSIVAVLFVNVLLGKLGIHHNQKRKVSSSQLVNHL